jgi:uncharacterized membrane protein
VDCSVFSILFLCIGNKFATSHALNITVSDSESEIKDQVFAKVIKLDSITPNQTDSSTNVVKFTCVITSGKGKGTSVHATQYAYKHNDTMPPQVHQNDKVVLGKLSAGSSTEYAFENYDRLEQIIWLLIAFVGLIVIFGGKKGLMTILSLALTCLAIFLVFIPCIMAGFNIYCSPIVICIYIIIVSYILTGGINKKSLASIIGCSGGVAFSATIYIIMERIMKLTGYYNDQTSRLKQTFMECPLDLKAIVFAMVTIGALGATMDVAMSIASSLEEIQNNKAGMTKIQIIQSGLTIGKDIMGTMTNTLILAYIGSSLITVLIYAVSNYPILQLLNKEEIIVEILQSLIGSLGMLFTIPFTTVISAYLFKSSNGNHLEKKEHLQTQLSTDEKPNKSHIISTIKIINK